MEARRRRPFDGLSDFLCRRRLSDEQARSLVLCGAFDSFGRPRPALMMELNLFCKHAKTAAFRRGCCDQPTLLRTYPTIPAPPGDYGWFRKYSDERRILSISIRRHLMALYRPLLNRSSPAAAIDSRQLEAAKGKCVRIAGVLEAQRTTRTERGEEMMFLTLDDEYGLFEVTLFPDISRRHRSGFSHYGPYVVIGRLEKQYDSLSITAESVKYFNATDEQLTIANEDHTKGNSRNPSGSANLSSLPCRTRRNTSWARAAIPSPTGLANSTRPERSSGRCYPGTCGTSRRSS